MSARISAGQTPGGLPQSVVWEQFQYAIVSSPSEIRLLELPRQKAEATRFENGHAFGEAAELRWALRANGRCHLVYVNDRGDCLPGSTDTAELKTLADGQIILWGERDAATNEFFDGRIPAPLPYPSGIGGARLAVRIRHYSLTQDPVREGEPERMCFLFRCVTIIPAELAI